MSLVGSVSCRRSVQQGRKDQRPLLVEWTAAVSILTDREKKQREREADEEFGGFCFVCCVLRVECCVLFVSSVLSVMTRVCVCVCVEFLALCKLKGGDE